MANENPMEGNPATGGDGSATPASSQSQGQPLEANLAGEIAKLQKKLDAQDGEIRALKGGKDAAVDRMVKAQEQTLARLAKYLNVDENQVREAQRQSVLDDLIAERLSGDPSVPTIQGRVEGADIPAGLRAVEAFSAADAIAEVERYNLSLNDPSFISLLRDKQLNRDKVKDYILGKVAPQPAASPATVVQPPAQSRAVGEKSAAQLEADYQKEASAILQTRTGDERIRAISQLKGKYRELGLAKV